MDEKFYLILYNGCNYLSMQGLKLSYVISKWGHRWQRNNQYEHNGNEDEVIQSNWANARLMNSLGVEI